MCTTIVVGRKRTADGSVLLAHSEELGRNSAHYLDITQAQDLPAGAAFASFSGGSVPQPSKTFRYLSARIFDKKRYPGDHTFGINQHQVAVANNMALMRDVPVDAAYDIIPGGVIWTEFIQLALERARGAREAVEVIGGLCEDFGLSADSGTMLAAADPAEAWWLEMARGGAWLAKKVGDDEIAMRANCYRFGAEKLDDPACCLHSRALVEDAARKGWHDRSEPFDFSRSYGDPANLADAYNTLRHEMIDAKTAKMERATVKDMMTLLRETYEGTPAYRADPRTGSPFRAGPRTIARLNTEHSSIAHLRGWLPPEVGAVWWCGMSTSLTTAYIPRHFGVTAIDEFHSKAGPGYDPASAYWVFAELSRLCDYSFNRCAGVIRHAWSRFEEAEAADLPELEAEALRLLEPDRAAALKLLTEYSSRRALECRDIAASLLAQAKTQAFYED